MYSTVMLAMAIKVLYIFPASHMQSGRYGSPGRSGLPGRSCFPVFPAFRRSGHKLQKEIKK
jgi:hypothetical protein